jgi:hypothetical protein
MNWPITPKAGRLWMDVKAMKDRSRTIWGKLLFLVVLSHFFDGARVEPAWAWGINNVSTDLSIMGISKNVVVCNYKEQKPLLMRNNVFSFPLRDVRPPASFFFWPNRPYRSERAGFFTFDCDRTHDLFPVAIMREDIGTSNSVTARARGYGRGRAIIFEMVAKNSGSIRIDLGIEGIRGGRLQSAGWVVNLKLAKTGPT